MMMWILLMVVLLVLTVVGFVYLTSRLARFQVMGKTPRRAKITSAIVLAIALAVLFLTMGLWNVAVCFIHALLIWLIADGVAKLYHKITGRPRRCYVAGVMAIIVTVSYLGAGYYCAHHVRRTEYTVTTDKAIPAEGVKIVGFSDLHAGTVFGSDRFAEYIERMSAEEADFAVIVGDFVDDDSSFTDMRESCEALKNLKTRYGTFYVFGNHDAGYYNNARRGYDKNDLIRCLEENGVIVLQDETVQLMEGVLLMGRQDLQRRERLTMDALTENINRAQYLVVLDHEPGDYDAEAAAKANLVLSGHTHGGQMIPINKVGEWTGINDRTYGYEKRGETDFIVSSGIADWALQFKTGCFSEYIVVNIVPAA